MSVDGKMCRVCLEAQKTSRFNRIFGNNGKIGKQIYELTGLKILEFKQCPALICPKCTGNLQRAIELRDSILDNNRLFNEIYKTCRFEEYDIDFTSEPSQWPLQESDQITEIKNEPMTSTDFTFDNTIRNYQSLEPQSFIITEVTNQKQNYENETGNYENPSTDPIEIKSEIKEEPEEIQELNYSSLPEELRFALDSNNSEDSCDNYLDEISQSTSQYSSELDRHEHSMRVPYQKRKPLSPGQLDRKRERDRLRKQQKRSNETEEEREARKQANAVRQRRRREILKDQQRLQNKMRTLIRRSNETEEQRQRRLTAERIRMAERRKTESEEKRKKRLEAERNRVAQKRNNESEEERHRRLELQRIRVAQRRKAQKK